MRTLTPWEVSKLIKLTINDLATEQELSLSFIEARANELLGYVELQREFDTHTSS